LPSLLPTSEEGVVIATIGHQAFAFPVEQVREVVPLVDPTPMPSWPAHVLGVIELRGELMPLVDVAEVLGQPRRPVSASQRVLVLTLPERTLGVLVDTVEGVASGHLRPTVGFAAGQGEGELARGVISELHGAVLVDPQVLVRALGVPSK
jgi:chemotaxis signal transduction protein